MEKKTPHNQEANGGQTWISKLNAWFAPLLAAADDPEAKQALISQYRECLITGFKGIALIKHHRSADIHRDAEGRLDLGRTITGDLFKELKARLANLKKQVEFVNESLNLLEGPAYADAIFRLGQLLEEDYKTRLELMTATKILKAQTLGSLDAHKRRLSGAKGKGNG